MTEMIFSTLAEMCVSPRFRTLLWRRKKERRKNRMISEREEGTKERSKRKATSGLRSMSPALWKEKEKSTVEVESETHVCYLKKFPKSGLWWAILTEDKQQNIIVSHQHHLAWQSTTNVINPPTPPPPHRNKGIIHRRTSSFCASNNERH